MRRRAFLLLVIVMMCAVVTIGGAITFVNSDSVLKKGRHEEVSTTLKDMRIVIDVVDNKLYLLSEDNIVKTYSIATGKSSTPSPVGNWIIVNKSTWGEGFGGRWMGLNVPWGTLFLEHNESNKMVNLCKKIYFNKI